MQRAKPYSPQLQRAHPLADRIGFFAVPGLGSQVDLVSGTLGTVVAGSLNVPTAVGEAYQSTAVSGQGIYWPFPRALEGLGNRYTMMWYGSVGTSGTGQYRKVICLPYRQDSSWSDPFIALDFGTAESSTNPNMGHSPSSGTYQYNTASGSGYWQEGTLNCYVASRDGPNVEFYRNGVLYHTWTGAGTDSPNFNATGGGARPTVNVANRNWQASGEGMFGITLAAGIWARSMPGDEVRRLTSDPFALARTRHRSRSLFFGIAGGGPPPSSLPHLYYQRMRAC
jgi:hypothetical protein